MVAIGSSYFKVPDRHPVPGRGDPALVVWVRGQHNASNQSGLCLTLAHAISLDGPGLILDLSGVPVMSSSTLAVIVRAREYLRERSASLTVRSPTAAVRHLIDSCGLNDLLAPSLKRQRAGGRESVRPLGRSARPGTKTILAHVGQGAGLRTEARRAKRLGGSTTGLVVRERP